MQILISLIGIAVLAALTYLIIHNKKPANSDSSLLLEYIEALRKELRESATNNSRETQEKLDKIEGRIAKGLEFSSTTMQKQFAQSAKIIKDITGELSKVGETNKQVLNFSEKLESLEHILKNPKQRGILGEYFLETLLGNVLNPNQYQMQYKFQGGEIVDAVIFFNEKIIPIDAKFSLENYNKIIEEKDEKKRGELEKQFKIDIKNRIDETSKYIRPKEDTTEFAFMFIPAEGVYYNLIAHKVGTLDINSTDLIGYAFNKHVIIVSPTSFFAYLETVLHGLNALKMEKSIMEVVKKVSSLGHHLNSYDAYMQKMGNNLGTTVNMYNSAYKEFKKIDKDVYSITDSTVGGKVEPVLLEKPLEHKEA
ncbi:DNA recombination protein RmuC [Candidatus Peregrinibacteria bacterium]|nr:DNA recombination protein RmuC [Candidatus Peregrinibacteria bacterium]